MRNLCVILIIFLSLPLWAANTKSDEKAPYFKEGTDYFTYLTPIGQPVRDDKKIIIYSFFTYDCSDCSSTQDVMELYSQINANRVFVIKQPAATEGALFTPQVYSSLIALGREDLADLFLFDATSEQLQQSPNNKNLILWLAQHGVDKDAFLKSLETPEIRQKVQSAVELTDKYGVFTLPFVVINGQYVLTQSTLYNDDYAFAVLDYLVDKVEHEQKLANSK